MEGITMTTELSASAEPEGLDSEVRAQLFTSMVRSRTFEERLVQEYHADKGPGFDIGRGLIPGEMHLSGGQEPVAAGVCAHLTADDAITAPHRPHHFAVAHGVDLKAMTAEIYGRVDGLGKGRGGHMHLFDPSTHFSSSGIVAEGCPPALGMAFAFARRGRDSVAVAVIGEGAANAGPVHESLNLAAIWQLPVIFVVEDNDWATSVPRSASTAVASNAVRAAGYGIPGVRIEDNDVEGVYAAAGEAVARARAGDGPSLIEVHTLRLWGHFEGDGQAYRPDLNQVADRDPIPKYEAKLRDAGVLDDPAVEKIRSAATAEVDAAFDFAKASPLPDPATVRDYLFA
jgi:pyruvate dehydrogenase E1 component alpha subunit